MGAAPRQRGKSEPCKLIENTSDSSSGDIFCPNAITTNTGPGCARPSRVARSAAAVAAVRMSSDSLRVLQSSGRTSGRFRSMANRLTGVGVSCLPRPATRSGWLTTSATRPASASMRSTGSPNAPDPKNTTSGSPAAPTDPRFPGTAGRAFIRQSSRSTESFRSFSARRTRSRSIGLILSIMSTPSR